MCLSVCVFVEGLCVNNLCASVRVCESVCTCVCMCVHACVCLLACVCTCVVCVCKCVHFNVAMLYEQSMEYIHTCVYIYLLLSPFSSTKS